MMPADGDHGRACGKQLAVDTRLVRSARAGIDLVVVRASREIASLSIRCDLAALKIDLENGRITDRP